MKNPQRHRDRKAHSGEPLGAPSMWLSVYGKRAFLAFKRELFWLKESHRLVVELGADLRGKLMDPMEVLGLPGRQELRRILAQLGATPADESKVTLPDEEEEDPDEAFFRRPH